ncbi:MULTISPECIES: hypothetical protein [Acidobacterium]|uniref:Uncharacterized protein n=1 Tax=Acidobacterium capsulatum (strain ATCC 51196 / DSM 11244 / BCRC 80197 / JCM 7670 / NBRC 15755 / NCIMB 13165 / 161) TaxID=240015 RepID=C1F6Q0_ACIC5|nr:MULTISPECIES: hypothetical protein [Acidobacterium]ACO31547.1 hypothetical protein ACP_1558 [Acidobacterium capsulatum ATCC 51196]HCT60944.1 hypothetical protein [Acidobacterium sp.]
MQFHQNERKNDISDHSSANTKQEEARGPSAAAGSAATRHRLPQASANGRRGACEEILEEDLYGAMSDTLPEMDIIFENISVI